MKISTNTKIAITLSIHGIDTIALLSSDKKEALNFYKLIEAEIESLQLSIRNKFSESKLEDKESH